LVADVGRLEHREFALGTCPLTWRQGLKHDAAAVMELIGDGRLVPFRNRLSEHVEVEPEFVYPLLKGTDLRRPSRERARRGVIVTQRRVGEETYSLEQRGPRLWSYLQRHARRFADRKSSIYRGQPPFALFGIGPYSFAPYKVAISGLHRPPRFQAVGPVAGKPVLFDDTCYLYPCHSAAEVAVLTALCNDPITLEVVHALIFSDAKRPITKGLLQRINLSAILDQTDRDALLARARIVLVDDRDLSADDFPDLADEIERLQRDFSR
jgi:hypothetical protein